MKLGSLVEGGRDGTLVVLDRTLTRAVPATGIASTLQSALENWTEVEEPLRKLSEALDADGVTGALRVADLEMASPLPRSHQFLDGAGYLGHMRKARAARGAEMPPNWDTDPVMYQGPSDRFLKVSDEMVIPDEGVGLDYESEIAALLDDVPMGTPVKEAAAHIKLLVLLNDYTLRALTKTELPKGFGFLQAKPTSGFALAAVTPDELGPRWDGERVQLRVRTSVNGSMVGEPDSGIGMHFTYPQFIAHAARTRDLAAGTILGAGTIANEDAENGFGCLAEVRHWETETYGAARTPWLRHGDVLEMEATADGQSVFGTLEHRIAATSKKNETNEPADKRR
ncbi:fumarylacetoacetate hydrolase family protein [Streptomyces sp. A012304]|uniref:fumarylacetoacetate hydrolase family protein n=1 Tax=Streptomyces sp. A012304 TaxID=375446 RepID=UPI00223116BB|nr:fumarylacetoacetate hydrolase family protein [Streptomyces sp. A012304]GKQ39164.1 fumarylacetoacetate hydrolase [Streptomyces sp. A012304]